MPDLPRNYMIRVLKNFANVMFKKDIFVEFK